MVKRILFNADIEKVIRSNLDIFAYEYPDVPKKDIEEYKKKPNCNCKRALFESFREDMQKFNSIMSKMMEEEVEVYFVRPLEEPMVKEFENIVEMESFLKDLKSRGIVIRSATPSTNGRGGWIMVIM
jgi:hypothetical protein